MPDQQLVESPPRSISIVVDEVRTRSPEVFGIFSGWQWESLRGKLLRAGFVPESQQIVLLDDVNQLDPDRLIVGLGEKTLRHFTEKRGIDKWQLSPLVTYDGRKFIPTFDLGRTQKQYELNLYQELALCRAFEEASSRSYERPAERFHLNPSLEETHAILDMVEKADEISIDVETGYGQINTVGFAWSESDAIAINVLPDRCSDGEFHRLFGRIRDILEGPAAKVFQNFIYDVSYFSAYGIRVVNVAHDTMWAMKFLWPELDMNLGNVGRLYTKRPYWKDDGKVEHEEGKKKDWGNVRDWTRHYLYNCRDTTGTFEAARNQHKDLVDRGLAGIFNVYLMRLADPILEMCANGMPLCLETRAALKAETETRITELTKALHAEVGAELNPNSPKQVMKLLRDNGITLPKKYDKKSGSYKESTDASSLKKVRLKHPEAPGLATLAEIKTLGKALSSYINFDTKPGEAILRYTLTGTGTETLRFSGNKDPWDRGFNIQTIPREGSKISIKSMFLAPEGWSFLEVDLRQAESRFVAYDAADKTLIDMLESDYDVHSHVAREILKKLGKDTEGISKEEFKRTWRQLGKKAGHGANYAMKSGVFVETCFKDMDVVLKRDEAETILEAYHDTFPGIRTWHAGIRRELNLKRKLTAPSGWERYFYGRFGDDMFKEAYAWRPQHTIPWVTNHLMLHLREWRINGGKEFKLIAQVHDSLILLVPDESLNDVAKVCTLTEDWHPEVILAGGRLIIPVEIKVAKRLSEAEEYVP